MDKFLKPERFSTEPNSVKSDQEWIHWLRTFENFIQHLEDATDAGKLQLLINYVSHSVYEFISECRSYDEAKNILQTIYVRPHNEIFARHKLAIRKQKIEETVDQFLQCLSQLGKECNFQAVSAEEHRDQYVRDSFINGLNSSIIRQRLLENNTLDLSQTINQARALESAQKHSAAYNSSPNLLVSAVDNVPIDENTSAAVSQRAKCFFCGKLRHPRIACPAKDSRCNTCDKLGHFAKVCRSKGNRSSSKNSASVNSAEAYSAAAPKCLKKSLVQVTINDLYNADALIDTGSSESFINREFVRLHKLPSIPANGQISMASTSFKSNITGQCVANMTIAEFEYPHSRFSILPNLCADIIVGHDILAQHSKMEMEFGGLKAPLRVCSLAVANVEPPPLFSNLSSNCRPIATKSRKHSKDDAVFISSEVEQLLFNDVIEVSSSPWRAQVLVTRNENHKRRMVIDYSQTINLFTNLDAYPLPKIEDLIAEIAKHEFFSTIDLSSAYHQIPILQHERIYTAFEAGGKLYQFKRIPFGVTNGVACFQRVIDKIIESERLQGVYAYLDDITVCGKNKEEHDIRLKAFMDAVKKYNLTINMEKSSFSKTAITLLGYEIRNRTIRPDPSRLDSLLKLPIPTDSSSLRRVLGMFAHYARWIPNFSQKISFLTDCNKFPISRAASEAFETIKMEIAKSAVSAIEDHVPFVVETDASDTTIAATLSQGSRPVAFFSRTLSNSEKNHSAVEKEAYAIVESLRKWRHFLIGRHFTLITDQQSVAFMFDSTHSSKIKNEKILRWRLDLSCYRFDIVYRPGKLNSAADAFSRVCLSSTKRSLFDVHKGLCHPGVTKMLHWVKTHNLPYSVNEVRTMISSCPVCSELKPKFIKTDCNLIKAMAPMERLNIDFKGPLPSATKNRYILTVIDEYSRFPFAFPCTDMTSSTVIKCLNKIFSMFGMASYVHSDRGSSFMSEELKTYLHSLNIATSRTTPYNPEGNGQVERFNGIIWKSIMLDLRTKGLEVSQWEKVIDNALFSIRSLLCTTTNCTPHEKMFTFKRKTVTGTSIPSWLSSPGPVLLRKYVRQSKFDPLVEEVDLLEANPQYAVIRSKNGRESTVSLKHLAPRGQIDFTIDDKLDDSTNDLFPNEVTSLNQEENDSQQPPDPEEVNQPESTTNRPIREKRSPKYLEDYVTF